MSTSRITRVVTTVNILQWVGCTLEDAYELIENMWPTERYTYGQRPSKVKAIQEDDRYQQLVDRINRIESKNSAPSIYGGDKPLFCYMTNPAGGMNYIENRGGNPYSNTYNFE
ncbi:hypothetical protein EPI10_000887 [Gossypium australe]|uniref:Uncharacterized protein n=1 Tax=Gossypium australe TaxID=47621 RepID=A0A5B6V9V1_9ROSI|nr:hypothetical protein EPI10_000887 [Gossypium australe]